MPPRAKRPRSPSPTAAPDASPQKAKKLKLLADYAAASPFPDHPHPTPEAAREVHAVLAAAHPAHASRRRPPREDANAAETCGKVPNVLESLIGTILSQNTSNKNSTGAKRMLDARFGRNNFAAIAAAPREDVVDALRSGGLANKKAKVIQDVLEEVKDRHGKYSLQHLSSATDDEIMQELVSYNGVGPKTASCVALFCLGRDSFAVDTHVFRLSRLLGWVPPRADRITAQAHLDLRVPAELKYGLHVLMVTHGRACPGCKGPGRKGDCVLKAWLRKKGIKEEEVESRAEAAGLEAEEKVGKVEDEVMGVKAEEQVLADQLMMEAGNEVKGEGSVKNESKQEVEDTLPPKRETRKRIARRKH